MLSSCRSDHLAATEPAEGAADGGHTNDGAGRQLSARQLALARGRAYGLLGRLFLAGVTSSNLAHVQAVPELNDKLALPFEADEAAADHHHLFGFNVHPYQSFFLDPAGLLGGPVTESVLRSYQSLGFQPETSAESADHIGFELELLAFLCAAEAEALQDGLPEIAYQMREHQLVFVQAHMLQWIGPLTLAVDQQAHRFYSALAHVALDLLDEHAAALSSQFDRPLQDAPALPAVPEILEDEGTGLKEIADLLLTPVYSGIYLSRDDIGRLARRQAIPRGFGDRRQLLSNLLRSAADYDALGEVIDSLQAVAARWLAGYDELSDREGAGVYIAGWRSRAAETAAMLKQMHGRVEALD